MIALPPDYYDLIDTRSDDPNFVTLRIRPRRWDHALSKAERQESEQRWGFYTTEPLPIKPRNRYRSPVRTFTGE